MFVTLLEILLDRLCELGERCRASAHPRACKYLNVVVARAEQPLQRCEVRSPGARLVRGDSRLSGARTIGKLDLCDARGLASASDERRELHFNAVYTFSYIP